MQIRPVLILVAALGIVAAQAQRSTPAAPLYRVEFDVRAAGGGKPQPSRHYTMLVDESRRAVLHAGNRLPVPNGKPEFIDVGANLDLGARASGDKVALDGSIELSGVTGQVCLSALCEPIVEQKKIAFHATVGLGTPSIIADTTSVNAAQPAPATRLEDPTPLADMRIVEVVVTRVN